MPAKARSKLGTLPGNEGGLTPHLKSEGLQWRGLGRAKNLSVHINYDDKWTANIDPATANTRLRLKSSQIAEGIKGFTEGPAILTGS